MESLVSALESFRGKRVLITGDTGFKGSWLSLWLHNHGAEVFVKVTVSRPSITFIGEYAKLATGDS